MKEGKLMQIPMSKKAALEQDAKRSAVEVEHQIHKHDDIIKIIPIVTINDWVVIIPFVLETNLILPMNADYRNVGIVVGRSESIMSHSGQFVCSRLMIGDVVLFQKKSVVAEMAISQYPYKDKRLIIISERNVVCKLPSVKFEIISDHISLDAIPCSD